MVDNPNNNFEQIDQIQDGIVDLWELNYLLKQNDASDLLNDALNDKANIDKLKGMMNSTLEAKISNIRENPYLIDSDSALILQTYAVINDIKINWKTVTVDWIPGSETRSVLTYCTKQWIGDIIESNIIEEKPKINLDNSHIKVNDDLITSKEGDIKTNSYDIESWKMVENIEKGTIYESESDWANEFDLKALDEQWVKVWGKEIVEKWDKKYLSFSFEDTGMFNESFNKRFIDISNIDNDNKKDINSQINELLKLEIVKAQKEAAFLNSEKFNKTFDDIKNDNALTELHKELWLEEDENLEVNSVEIKTKWDEKKVTVEFETWWGDTYITIPYNWYETISKLLEKESVNLLEQLKKDNKEASDKSKKAHENVLKSFWL